MLTLVIRDTIGMGGFAKVKAARHKITGEKVYNNERVQNNERRILG